MRVMMKLVDGYQPGERVQLVAGQQGIVMVTEVDRYRVHFGLIDRAPRVEWVARELIIEPEYVVTPEEIVARGDAQLLGV
jgi:hypothetical protein